jgi:hypothetical protein
MAKKKEDKITVEALCRVTASQAGISEEIRKFDKAWTRMRELAKESVPVSLEFVGFVRIDDK